MNKAVKYILAGVFGLVAAVYMSAALGAGAQKRAEQVCTGLNVTVADSSERSFVTAADVRGYLDKEFSGYKGMAVKALDLKRAESIVDSKSAVRKSQVYLTKDGMLNVIVTQREPVIRFQKKDGGFYADSKGYIFPLQSNYTARVPIVDGEIPVRTGAGFKGMLPEGKEKEWIDKVLEMVRYMGEDKVWAEDIVQISVNPDGDIIMIPREGKEKFIFGGPDRYEEKFALMELYYTGILPAKGKDRYSTVNVKYADQIICRK